MPKIQVTLAEVLYQGTKYENASIFRTDKGMLCIMVNPNVTEEQSFTTERTKNRPAEDITFTKVAVLAPKFGKGGMPVEGAGISIKLRVNQLRPKNGNGKPVAANDMAEIEF